MRPVFTPEQIVNVREWGKGDWSDEEILGALAQARDWVGRWRYSETYVAVNILKDGYPHP